MINIHALLKAMVDRNSSDLHVRCRVVPIMRVNGELFKVGTDPVSPENMEAMLRTLLSQEQYAKFQREPELDFATMLPGVGRFRINVFRQRGTPAMAIRSIKVEIPNFSELALPNVIMDISMKRRGMILVTGTTGSGKSTLLASMVDHINASTSVNIVTIEDPIEFLHRDKRSIVAQREIGTDSPNFNSALRASFRQDPDIILIGEMRDCETIETAMSAADTGHLVMSTLHTMNTTETITRIISFFPPHQHDQIRLVLSNVLVAIISLRLLPRKDGAGRIPAAEILINHAAISEYILNPEKSHQILPAISEGHSQYGSQSFDQSLLQLYQNDMITLDIAKQNASNPDDFELTVRGVSGTSDRRWMV
ncbi:MAG: PilT/PilU family type 4a pilus ATPase [Chitinispirillales bacterium]|jgi:twitching motility protein PilT|nr:PilT/PilU family type 4a pilus ATPase [Chitinispirillales bacterium]